MADGAIRYDDGGMILLGLDIKPPTGTEHRFPELPRDSSRRPKAFPWS